MHAASRLEYATYEPKKDYIIVYRSPDQRVHFATLRPREVIDPRTGRHIFAKTDREVKITVLPEQETPPPTLSVDPSGKPPSAAKQASHAINVGMHTARSSLQSSRTIKSASRSLKNARKTALLTLRIGEYVVKKQVCTQREVADYLLTFTLTCF